MKKPTCHDDIIIDELVHRLNVGHLVIFDWWRPMSTPGRRSTRPGGMTTSWRLVEEYSIMLQKVDNGILTERFVSLFRWSAVRRDGLAVGTLRVWRRCYVVLRLWVVSGWNEKISLLSNRYFQVQIGEMRWSMRRCSCSSAAVSGATKAVRLEMFAPIQHYVVFPTCRSY